MSEILLKFYSCLSYQHLKKIKRKKVDEKISSIRNWFREILISWSSAVNVDTILPCRLRVTYQKANYFWWILGKMFDQGMNSNLFIQSFFLTTADGKWEDFFDLGEKFRYRNGIPDWRQNNRLKLIFELFSTVEIWL